MDVSLLEEINKLVLDYKNDENELLLKEIQKKLMLLEFQTVILKQKLGLVEDPELKFYAKEIRDYQYRLSHYNALNKYHLIIPLIMHLLKNHDTDKPAYETSLDFMRAIKEYLREGDYAKLKTGSQRFITNTRFAADILRKYGLLRSDRRTFFKVWELSPYGLVVACNLYVDGYRYFNREFFNEQNSTQTEIEVFKKLNEYAKRSNALENLLLLVEYVREEEELVLAGQERLGNYLKKFTLLIDAILEKGKINKTKETTQNLIAFMEKNNVDATFSLFADGLKLRKDIELNMRDVYKILGKK